VIKPAENQRVFVLSVFFNRYDKTIRAVAEKGGLAKFLFLIGKIQTHWKELFETAMAEFQFLIVKIQTLQSRGRVR
jgi:hypothetical protein